MDVTMGNGSSWEPGPREGGRLAARWWKWALSAPDELSPVRDTTGEHAGWRQPADLWFLAGTYGGKVVRRCEIPAGRRLFFPVLNIHHTRSYSATRLTLPVERAQVFLNGVELPLQEFGSSFRQGIRLHLCWGLWAGLNPLSPGQYVLEIKANTTTGFGVDTTYHLTVTPD